MAARAGFLSIGRPTPFTKLYLLTARYRDEQMHYWPSCNVRS